MARRGWSYGDAKAELERLRGKVSVFDSDDDETAA
jgi:hypothetical protein